MNGQKKRMNTTWYRKEVEQIKVKGLMGKWMEKEKIEHNKIQQRDGTNQS